MRDDKTEGEDDEKTEPEIILNIVGNSGPYILPTTPQPEPPSSGE